MPKSLKKTPTSAGSPRSTPSKRDAPWDCGTNPPKHRVVELSKERKGTSTMTTAALSIPKGANPLRGLSDFGQSVWLDYIRRSLITSGELKRLVAEDGLR